MKRPFSDAWLILEDIKLLFLYCLVSGIHLSLSAYKRRKVKQSKQGRKKKKKSKHGLLQKQWQNGEFKERLRKLHHSFQMPGMRVLGLVQHIWSAVASRRAASPHEWMTERSLALHSPAALRCCWAQLQWQHCFNPGARAHVPRPVKMEGGLKPLFIHLVLVISGFIIIPNTRSFHIPEFFISWLPNVLLLNTKTFT